MKIGISMRMCTERYPSGTYEERDALAQDWHTFLRTVLPNASWAPIPNIGESVLHMVDAFNIEGFILSGGNDLKEAALRDLTESYLIKYAIQNKLPILGICRGAQMLNDFSGGRIKQLSHKHMATQHTIKLLDKEILVNSYHKYGFFDADLANNLEPLAYATDMSVEAFQHSSLPWLGIMWHPEREKKYLQWDCSQIQNLFKET